MKKSVKNELTPIRLKFDPFGSYMKVYNDGHHFIGTKTIMHDKKKNAVKRELTDADKLFDELYFNAVKQNLKHFALREYLKNGMLEQYPNFENIDNYVEEHIRRKIHNFYSRMKRFKRKANLNKWNYFVTLTFDDKKMNAETFKRKLRKCLSNLHCRRNWRYMGVFELSPTENRLHFHALMYIPQGEMLGVISEETSYSTKKHAMQTAHINSFFADKFGRNDFAQITEEDLKFGRTTEYITKYLSKTNEKIVYSRGIPTELNLYIENQDIATEYDDYVVKFVLFDDCIDSDGIYTAWRPPKYCQSSLLGCS